MEIIKLLGGVGSWLVPVWFVLAYVTVGTEISAGRQVALGGIMLVVHVFGLMTGIVIGMKKP